MLKTEQFEKRLLQPNHPDWLLVGIDTQEKSQLYIAGNGGMNNMNCAPIENYLPEIKSCALEMIDEGQLYLEANAKALRIGQGRSAYFYTLQTTPDTSNNKSNTFKFQFSNLFVKWQRTLQVSDIRAQEMLHLTSIEFTQFREGKLDISDMLIERLHQSTGFSRQLWLNRLAKHKERYQK
ncbi:MAG: hypothetical protein HRT54_07535 [Colwellia sp.]|nr:hypothetical protein [Colwellia sp.]